MRSATICRNNPSAPHVDAQNLSRNTITISSLYLNALLNALNALLNASRHRRATYDRILFA